MVLHLALNQGLGGSNPSLPATNTFVCRYCNSVRKNHNSLRNHERCCPLNANRNYKNGMTGKRGKNQYTKARRLGLPDPEVSRETRMKLSVASTGKTLPEYAKQKISAKLSINNRGGRSKWYEVNGIKVQGTWERDVAQVMTDKKIKWIKPTSSKHSLNYKIENIQKTYTPDFYLEDLNLYLEVKGYWWGNDREKMNYVFEQNPDVKIVIIERNEYEKILDGELVW